MSRVNVDPALAGVEPGGSGPGPGGGFALRRRPVLRSGVVFRLLAAVLAVSGLGCGVLGPITVEIPATAVIRGMRSSIPGAGDDWAGFGGASSSIARTIDNQGVKRSDLKSARLKQGRISVLLPEDGHLGSLEEFAVYIEAPGLERRRIAHQSEAFARKTGSVDLVIDDVELVEYVAAEQLTLSPHVVIGTPPEIDHEIEVVLVFAFVPSIGG